MIYDEVKHSHLSMEAECDLMLTEVMIMDLQARSNVREFGLTRLSWPSS